MSNQLLAQVIRARAAIKKIAYQRTEKFIGESLLHERVDDPWGFGRRQHGVRINSSVQASSPDGSTQFVDDSSAWRWSA